MNNGLRVTGLQATLRGMERLKNGAVVNVKQGLLTAAHLVLAKAIHYCPKETGQLAGTGQIEGNESGGLASRFTVSFGGPTDQSPEGADYAAFVHEMTEIPHDPPTCAKFLARAIAETKYKQIQAVQRAVEVRDMRTTEVISGTQTKYAWTEYENLAYTTDKPLDYSRPKIKSGDRK